jgi:hypothetical protein
VQRVPRPCRGQENPGVSNAGPVLRRFRSLITSTRRSTPSERSGAFPCKSSALLSSEHIADCLVITVQQGCACNFRSHEFPGASSGIQGFPAELWMRIVDPQFVPVLICYCSIQMNREHSALRMRTSSERIETEPRIFECCYPQLYSVENRRKYRQQSCSSFRSANISATHATRNDPRIGPGCISCSAAKSVAWLIGTNGYDVAATGSQI